MGMYDEIVCEYPLPGSPPAFAATAGHAFQTKDLDGMLIAYTIHVDGTITPSLGEKFTGSIVFYTSNICGGGPGRYTRNGEDAHSVSYVAIFVDGALKELREDSNEIAPAMPISKMRVQGPRLTKEDVDEIRRRQAESLIGRVIYVMWGGQADGYVASVIAEDAKEFVVQSKTRGFEKIDRRNRDATFFDNEADAKESRKSRNDEWVEQRQEWEAYVSKWNAERGIAPLPAGKG